MSEGKTWLETIEATHSDPRMREMLIQEAQKTHFIGNLPADFAFLRGAILDLGFEKLDLRPDQLAQVRRAFVSSGLAVPGTGLRLRNIGPCRTGVEPAHGTEQATLPDHWQQGVLVLGYDDRFSWIGKRASLEQLGNIDLSGYDDAGDGWRLKGWEAEVWSWFSDHNHDRYIESRDDEGGWAPREAIIEALQDLGMLPTVVIQK